MTNRRRPSSAAFVVRPLWRARTSRRSVSVASLWVVLAAAAVNLVDAAASSLPRVAAQEPHQHQHDKSKAKTDDWAAAAVTIQQPLQQQRSLGDITSRLSGLTRNSGSAAFWEEFRHGTPAVGSQVTPCPDVDYCSSDSNRSEPLAPLEAPWTFAATTCMNLTVMEGYYSGQATYQVSNRGLVLGSTSKGSYSEDCWDDPDTCHALPPTVVGRGSWLLKPGNHSLTIVIQNLTGDYPDDVNDGGWFRLTSTPCPCTALNVACASTSTCCGALVCRKTQITSGQLRCLSCRAKSQTCAATANCCSGLRCLPIKQGSTTKVCK